MTPKEWVTGRKDAGWTQVEAAKALRISQPYLSQLEKGTRAATPALAQRAMRLYELPPTVLPVHPRSERGATPGQIEREIAALGYPGFAHVHSGKRRNPAEVLAGAVSQNDLDVRLVEALPWVLATYPGLDWQWLCDQVKLRNAQNRLGYLVHLAKGTRGLVSGDGSLSTWEAELEAARLAREGTLCRDSMTEGERAWVRTHRPAAAAHWNLLTTLTAEQLAYARE